MHARLQTRWRSVPIAFLLCIAGAHASGMAVYYVSAAGSDTNDGRTSASPWKTIAKVNAFVFAAGDEIRFHAGDTFYGEITVGQESLTIGRYGGDAKPMITGGVDLTGWQPFSGAVYKTTAGVFVKDLFCNGVQMTLARSPNTGFYTVGATNGSTWISSPGAALSSGSWTGGRLHIRTRDWTYETRPVTSHTGSTIECTGDPEFPYAVGWGFYLDNMLHALDAPGEWYCDPAANTVYLYAPGGVNPSALTVTGVVADHGISSAQSGTTIRGVALSYQAASAIRVYGTAARVTIAENDVFGQWMHGIEFVGTHSSCTIDGNTIRNVNGRGINLIAPHYFTITNNTIKNIGLVPGYGSSGFTGLTAIIAQAGDHNTISGNCIDSVGYIGIRHDGANNLIENNLISNTMLKLADGGAIYAWGGTGGTYGTTIRNNIIENVPGDNTGVPNQPSMKQGYGIYFDLGCHTMTMEGNTIIHAGDAAVFVQYSDYDITIRNNTFYECAGNYYAATFDLVQDNTQRHGGHVITHNIFVPLNNKAPLVRVQLSASSRIVESVGTIDSNAYYDRFDKGRFHLVRTGGLCNTYVYSFPEWKSALGQDASSTVTKTNLTPSAVRSAVHRNFQRDKK
jgi:parallel beta-helix repeat protein